MILRYYLQNIRRLWWLVVICVLIAFATSLIITLSVTPLYRATATFIVAPNPNLTSSRDLMTSLDTLSNASIIPTYADILRSNRIFTEAVRELGLTTESLKDYHQQINVKTVSGILELVVEGPDPEVCTAIANAMGKNGIIYIQGIYQVFDINFLDQATLPEKPFYPTPLKDSGIAAGIGLLVGVVLAVVSESIRIPLEVLRERSITDKITSAYNQNYFRRRVEQELTRSPSDPISLALIRLEGIRDLQNVLPETVLKRLMHSVTDVLRSKLYGTDIIGQWEKNGYSILMLTTPGNAALRTMERIRQVLCGPVEIDEGEKVELQPCVGIASRSHPDENAGELIGHASTALEKSCQSVDYEAVLYGGE